jgi:ligand-binding sensor domain-containing protein/signal transduction histidine kinase
MLRRTATLILGFCSALFAQFEHLSLEHGLSQTTVKCILQDRKGYLWFGTSDGLNKYDGYNFTIYRHNALDAHSLSDDNICAIAEDKSGALWVGTTRGGLNRFDRAGERFVRYTLPVPTGPAGAAENESADLPFIFSFFVDQTITALHVDFSRGDHNLWIGTWRNGLYKINLNQIGEMASPDQGLATGAVTHYQHHPADPKSLSDNRIRAICRDREGRLWIGTFGGGLNRFDDATASFQHFKHDLSNPHSLSDNHVLSLYGESSGALWVGTLGGGLNKLVPITSVPISEPSASSSRKFAPSDFDHRHNNIASGFRFIHYRHDPANAFSLSGNDVTAILEDRNQTLWVGTFGGGLNQFDPATECFAHFRRDRFNSNSFRANDVLSIYEDQSGIIWIGSQLGVGVSKYDRRKEKFMHYKNDPSNPHSLSDDVIWSLFAAPGRDDIVWIGTYHGGLNRFDRKTGRFIAFRHDPADPNSLSQNHVRAICEDEAGALWVGTFSEGLNKFPPDVSEKSRRGSGQFTRYRHDPSNPHSLSHNSVRALHKDKSGTLWIGTIGGGLNRFEKGSGRFIRYQHHPANPNSLSDDRVYTIYEDRAGTLWIGTFGGGLNKIFIPNLTGEAKNFEGLYFVSYKNDATDSTSLGDNRVMAICEGRDGTLWIGTFGGGLNQFDRASGKFRRFGMHNGLPSDVIYGILEDASGNLWISSNSGLSRFNPRALTCKNYDERDGLQSREFSGGAFAKSPAPRDAMFFGGINGLNYFYSDSIQDNSFVPPIVITAFKKFNEVAGREMEKIDLAHSDNFFSFDFSALDFADPAKNQYAYYLEGFEQSWIFSGTRHTVSYTNLDPGRYTFRVKGANNDGIWNDAGAAVRITIHPPFWQTWWFRLSALVLLVATILILHEYRVKQKIGNMLKLEQVRKAENEKLRKQVADDFHDEFGQKLTNIALFAEIIRRNLNGTAPQTAAHLHKINDAAASLSDGMRDFIWTLDRNKDSFYNVATRLKDCGELLFGKTKICFAMTDFSPDWENILLSMDWKRHLIQIFKEGMKNAAKHAECANVTLDLACTDRRLDIRLADDGKGFENDDTEYGAGLRYIKKRAGKIGGDLKIISRPGQGTMIQFTGQISGNADEPQTNRRVQ